MKKALILVNHEIMIYNLRKELVVELLKEGYEVTISCPKGEKLKYFTDLGCKHEDIVIDCHGTNPFRDMKLISYYKKLMKREKPDIVITYTIKPTLYGSFAAKSLHIPYISTITGMGTGLENGGPLQKLILMMYKRAFKKINCVFFQNKNNLAFFKKHKLVKDNYCLVSGSGVNLDEYTLGPKRNTESGNETFLFVARIVKNKGVEEFLEAAARIKQIYPNITFNIVGSMDADYNDAFKKAEEAGTIKYHGRQKDVRPFYAECDAVVLPSYYEGIANALLEGAATGRAVIASEIPGCVETFDEGVSGISVKPRDPESLYQGLLKFINLTPEEKSEMGLKGREKVAKEFNRYDVMQKYVDKINEICLGKNS